VREGDSGAFGEIYRRYHDELLFAVRAHLGPKLRTALESEDILQSVVIDAFRALPRFEPRGPGSLKHYLHAMIVNKIRSRAEYHGAARRSGTVPPKKYMDGLMMRIYLSVMKELLKACNGSVMGKCRQATL
jgi:DNA-directed RNA polymerase specialized sigma24 family protein